MSIIDNSPIQINLATASAKEIKQVETQAVDSLNAVLDVLSEQNPALFTKLSSLKESLEAISSDLGEIIAGTQAADAAKAARVAKKIPQIEAALGQALVAGGLDAKGLESISAPWGSVLIVYGYYWGDKDAIEKFTAIANDVMKTQFKDVPYQVHSNGLE